MYYKLTPLDSTEKVPANYTIMNTEPTKEYVLEITSLPPPRTYAKSNNNNNKRLDNKKILKECLDILYNKYSIREEDIRRGRNIFCPIHENSKTSKTPSAILNVKSGYFTCFSSNCTIPQNKKNGYRQLRIAQLLKKMEK